MYIPTTTLIASAATISSLYKAQILTNRSINNGMTLKIMPFGASITAGQDSTNRNGYRLKLQQLLEDDGIKVSLVGTFTGGDMPNGAFEAKPGKKIYEMDQRAQADGSYDYKPNVILVNLGTDDCNVGPTDLDAAPGDYSMLLKHMKAKNPHATIFASSLVPNLNHETDTCITRLNKGLEEAAMKAKHGGQKVVWVDMNQAVPRMDINVNDKTHPNDEGYDLMAQAWYEAIKANSAMISAADPKGKAAPMVADSRKTDDEPTGKVQEKPTKSC
ncbi:Hypothetical protein R9X50_00150400 [Acrodontium crateriforme]|uniref:SGNH hydrolase-type esterase domain-containing protein n=1 Tax=Acrodontium crateriforme TaxID=150365 RepID=A0AAQ3R7Y2_9PEZI|nr:Hypothetical protein R9X50_00150400 [Acrodontium crateriforme]